MMKILFWQWHSFMGKGVKYALDRLGIEYDSFFYQMKNWEEDEQFISQIDDYMEKRQYDAVFSINYNPLISIVCQGRQVPYVAWIYDSPIHIRDISSMSNSCNRLYFFDREQAQGYKEQGIDARYMPLAADVRTFEKVLLNQKEQNAYCADVALVGQLYQTAYVQYMSMLPEYQRGYLEGILASQKLIYGGYFLHDFMTEELLSELNASWEASSNGQIHVDVRELEFLLASEITSRERLEALTLLSNHFDMAWYSNDSISQLAKVRKKPYVDYYTQMPQVFKNSKINLNISLKTIQSGIPLRVLDIMACGGFVLTNFQEEMAEYFKLGEELVTYSDIEELFYQTKYYLEHEDERRKIAARGFKRVETDFSFEDRMRRMLLEE